MGTIAKSVQSYVPPYGTVQVVLDAELSRQRKKLLDEIQAAREEAKGRLVTPKLKKLNDELESLTEREREHVHKLQITKMAGMEWADLAATFPPRLNVQFDLDLGYNHHAASIASARHVSTDGRPITVELVDVPDGPRDPEADYRTVDGVEYLAQPLDDDDWTAILETGAGWDIDNIVTLVVNLNILQASNRLGRLKKD